MKILLLISIMTVTGGLFAAEKYAISVFERPFTMPKNSFETGLRFSKSNIAEIDVDYGITEHFQLGLSWDGVNMNNKVDRRISLNLSHYLFSTRYVSSMAIVRTPFVFNSNVIQEMTVSVPTYIPLVRGHLNLVLLENIVKVDWLKAPYADFAFQTRLSWQATHAFCISLISSPGKLSTSGNHVHILNQTPLSVRALYAITSMVDIVGSIGYENVQQVHVWENNFTAMIGFSLRGGDIEG